MKEFGKYAVIICDVEEFLRRVRNAFQRYCHEDNAAYELRYDRVSYDVDLFGPFDYDGFHKTEDYSWQNEFRISVDFTEGKFSEKILADTTDFAIAMFPWKIEIDDNPLSLSDSFYFEIGDIRDICVCVDVDQFFEGKESISIQEEPSHIEPQNMPRKPRPSFYKWVSIISSSNGIHLRVSEKALYGACQ